MNRFEHHPIVESIVGFHRLMCFCWLSCHAIKISPIKHSMLLDCTYVNLSLGRTEDGTLGAQSCQVPAPVSRVGTSN